MRAELIASWCRGSPPVRAALTLARVAFAVLALATARNAHAQARAAVLADLPLTEVPATAARTTAAPAGAAGRMFAVFLTGDGGWAALDQGVSARLAGAGIPVVGFNQRSYLWTAKTPDQAAADLARIITVYRAQWHRDSVLVIGYSRGAGVAPFAVNRLPPPLRGTVKAVVLIGSEHTAGFQFRMRDLFRSTPAPDDIPLMPEIHKLGATLLACFYGADEEDTICPDLPPPAVVVKMKGGHHLEGAYEEIGRRILALLR